MARTKQIPATKPSVPRGQFVINNNPLGADLQKSVQADQQAGKPDSENEIRLARAALRGLVQSDQFPSLLRRSLTEPFLVSRSRLVVYEFLRKMIRSKRKRDQVQVPMTVRSSEDVTLSSLKWLPALIKNQSSCYLREAASNFLFDTLKRKDNEFDLVEQGSIMLLSISNDSEVDPSSCTELVTELNNLLSTNPDLAAVAIRAGIIKSSQTLLDHVVSSILDAQLRFRVPPDWFLASLTALITLLTGLLKEHRFRERYRKDIALLNAVAMLESFQIGSQPMFECATKLREAYSELEKSAEATVKEGARLLREYSKRIHSADANGGKSFSRLFPFVSATSVVLHEIVNAIVPKHKVPDVTLQLQRAPTQEEYFRSGLSKSTIQLTDVSSSVIDGVESPRVQDLKAKIASELGMSSSLEMFELVVAGKILGPELELARVFDRIWKPHVAERAKHISGAAEGVGSRRNESRRAMGRGSSEPEVAFSSLLYRSHPPRQGGSRLAEFESNLANRLASLGAPPPSSFFNRASATVNPSRRSFSQLLGNVVDSEDDDDEDEHDDDDDEDGDEDGPAGGNGVLVSGHHLLDGFDGAEHDEEDDDDESLSESGLLGHAAAAIASSVAHNARKLPDISYPPMVVTYRLCAVDGEATEDFVTSLPLGEGETDGKKEFYSATTEYGESGLKTLLGLVGLCVDNLRSPSWPFPVAKDLLLLTLTALEQCVTHNGAGLLRLGALPVLLRCLVDCSSTGGSTNDSLASLCLSILDRLVSGPTGMEELEEGAFTGTSENPKQSVVSEEMDTMVSRSSSGSSTLGASGGGGDQLDWVLERLDSFSATRPKLVTALAKLAPHLINGRVEKAKQLAEQLLTKKDEPWALSVIENLSSTSEDAMLLRNALYELGIPQGCVAEILKSTAETFLDHAGRSETLLALRILKGLVRGHALSSRLICESQALATIVRLEEVSSLKVEQVGSLAYAVLEALTMPQKSSQDVRDAVARAQKERKEEIRAIAMKKTNKMMKSMSKSSKLQPPPPSSSSTSGSQSQPQQQQPANKRQKRWMDELTMLEEEDSSIVCIVCHEGYKSKPNYLMCAYTFEKAVPLAQGSSFLAASSQVKNGSSSTSTVYCVASTSGFVCIHQSCHESAARADRSHPKAPKDEWEGAELRNGHVRCNNLIPLRGQAPQGIYDAAVHSFFERIDRDTKAKISSGSYSNDPSLFSLVCHDIRLLFTRISFGENLTEDTRGGSIESNLKLLVPLLQMGNQLLLSDQQQKSSAEALLASFISCASSSSSSSVPPTPPCDFAFALVLSLFFLDSVRWQETRLDSFIKSHLVAHAMMVQSNAQSGDASSIGSGLLAGSAAQAAVNAAAAAALAAAAGSSTTGGGRQRGRSRARSLSVASVSPTGALPDDAAPPMSPTSSSASDIIPRVLRPWIVFFALVDRAHRAGPLGKLADKAALEATHAIAEDARQMLATCQSMQAMTVVLQLQSKEQLKGLVRLS